MSDFEKLINASDLIEWLMEAFPDWCVGSVRSIVDYVEALPSAQPEIIRCKDCRWHEQEQPGMVYCPNIMGNWVEDDWFCADGARREDDSD